MYNDIKHDFEEYQAFILNPDLIKVDDELSRMESEKLKLSGELGTLIVLARSDETKISALKELMKKFRAKQLFTKAEQIELEMKPFVINLLITWISISATSLEIVPAIIHLS